MYVDHNAIGPTVVDEVSRHRPETALCGRGPGRLSATSWQCHQGHGRDVAPQFPWREWTRARRHTILRRMASAGTSHEASPFGSRLRYWRGDPRRQPARAGAECDALSIELTYPQDQAAEPFFRHAHANRS
jgi:hypothetical protein